ncbi:MAG: hypothetical protein IBJ11_05170 [Phycisphaerales bacterium]|nr:hypothetical protein [Phycisphaerales bacterium]
MPIRLGEVLVRQGLLTSEQVAQILEEQSRSQRPFGLLAEKLFGLSERDIERAWAEQYAVLSGTIDPRTEKTDPAALGAVDRRQAWQFRVLPLRFDGAELMLATTKENLPRALRFASRCLDRPCYLVVTEPELLGEALVRHYPMPGMTAASVAEGKPRIAKAG